VTGRLCVVSTPIGNLADITFRAVRVLGEVDVIAAEDTRTTRKLLTHHGVHTPLVSYHRDNEDIRTKELLERLLAGENVAIVSEAGTPSISDPGYRLILAAIEHDVPVEPIPGPSAPIAALVVSGLPSDSFVFEGFLPRRAAERRKVLASLSDEPRTLVFFEAPHRVDASVQDMLAELGDRPAALCRELTKLHEQVRRGSLSQLQASLVREPVKGEIVLVVSGKTLKGFTGPEIDEAAADAEILIAGGETARDAIDTVAAERGVSRRALYDRVMERRRAR
jgi:16S rRNA (cytidine1402-2'-O)-methyltransferase